jgi:hypothetical protein
MRTRPRAHLRSTPNCAGHVAKKPRGHARGLHTRMRKLSLCQVIIVRRSWDDPISQECFWTSSDRNASAQRWLEHLSARWDRGVFCADGKEACGLDHFGACLRLPTPFSMTNGIVCKSHSNVLSLLAKHVVTSNVCIDARFSSSFASRFSKGPLMRPCLHSSPLHERSFRIVQR